MISQEIKEINTEQAKKIRDFIFELDDVLGFVKAIYREYLSRLQRKAKTKIVKDLLKKRETARRLGDYRESDRIREKLSRLGLIVEDTKEGYALKMHLEI
jgi:cysteinyl-tRNA synthetase